MNVTTGSTGNNSRVINIATNHTFAGFDTDSISVDTLQNVKTGQIADAGGKFTSPDKINFFISGSPVAGNNAARNNMFISSSGFIVTADGNVTASNIDLSGGLAAEGITATFGFFGDKLAVGGTEEVPNVIISASGEFSSSNFFVDKNGNVTASNMKLQGGLDAESVAANYGFFGSALEVGGTQGSPRVKIGLLEGTAEHLHRSMV